MGNGLRWTEEDLAARGIPVPGVAPAPAAAATAARAHKYHAIPTEVDGHLFPSRREAERYLALRLLEQQGLIEELRLQFRFPLHVKDIEIGHWVADFTYTDSETGAPVVEDAKGMRTETYRWKKRHFEAQYAIRIREV